MNTNKHAGDFNQGFTVRGVLLLVFLLWCFAFALACRLTGRPELQKNADNGLVAKLFGSTRFEIGEQFYEQADLVFHKGISHHRPAAFKDWFTKMRDEVSPTGHFHLHKEGILEIMPWLYFAARADPGNVTAYTVAAYWLAGEGGRPDLAERVLNEALRNNPSDYRIYMEKGNLALKEGNYGKAARFLDTAFSLLPGPAARDKVYPPEAAPEAARVYPPSPRLRRASPPTADFGELSRTAQVYQAKGMATREQVRIDRAGILTYRGLLYEIDRRPENALHCYREVVRMFPGRTQLKERIIELEKNGRAPTPPEELARILLFQHRHVCAEEEDE